MKKILSLILALLMIVSCASFIFAEEEVPADDVAAEDILIAPAPEADAEEAPAAEEETSDYMDAIKFLVNYDIMHGKGNTLGVKDDIKRYEMALFIGRLCTGWVDDSAWEDGTENTSGFTDLAGTAAENYYGAISYVANKGIIEGVGGNKFAPEAGIKYEDALTMAVRALGYKGLSYPWGYIEKAVELGLTDKITGVAYTETLKREVVAQIIYNALFAQNADGKTYGEANFGIINTYDVVIITATDASHFLANGENAAEGYVAFQKVNADGSIGKQIYTATAESFGFEGHDDEANLGAAYKVCFKGEGNVEICSVESLEVEAIVNAGTDSKSAGKYPIKAFLDDNKLVSAITGDNQVIIYVDDGEAIQVIDELYAIDWLSGDILYRTADDDYVVEWFYNSLLNVYFRYKFDSNGKVLGTEYKSLNDMKELMKNATKSSTKSSVAVYHKLTDEKDIKAKATTAYAQLRLFDIDGDGEGEYGIFDAYRFGYLATDGMILDTTNLKYHVGDDMAAVKGYFPNQPEYWFPKFDRNFEKYVAKGLEVWDYSEVTNGGSRFGTITLVDTTTCIDVEGCQPGWVSFQFGGQSYNGRPSEEGKIVYFGLTADSVWSREGYGMPTDADGNVQNAWVIYGCDPATNEIKIVDVLEDYVEGDVTYKATGILRAFNTTKKTVTIGDTTFSTSYDELTGSTFTSEWYRDGVWYKGSAYLNQFLNQFVTYYVVDEKVVFVEACGAENQRFFIVDGFAGVNKDGYIVLDVFDTADGAAKQVKVSAAENWKFGDYFYYANFYSGDVFENGTFLRITSYDKATDTYSVNPVYGLPKSGEDTGNRQVVGDLSFRWTTYNFTSAPLLGYRAENNPNLYPNGSKNITADDTYVFIYAPGQVAGSPVRIFKGAVTDPNWYIEGWRLENTADNMFIFVNCEAGDINGFTTTKNLNKSLVMILDYKDKNFSGEDHTTDYGSWFLPDLGHYSGWQIQLGNSEGSDGDGYFKQADYHPWGYVTNAAYAGEGDQLLGNTQYTVMVMNLRTLHTEAVTVSNKNMKANYIYECVDGKVVGEPHKASDLYGLLLGTYAHQGIDLLNDQIEVFTTAFKTANKAAHKNNPRGDNSDATSSGKKYIFDRFTSLYINKFYLGESVLGIVGGAADYGTLFVKRQWKNNAVVSVYEGKDGHAEIAVLGIDDGQTGTGFNTSGTKGQFNLTANGGYGAFGLHTDVMSVGNNPQHSILFYVTGKNNDITMATVTLINLDITALQGNADPYGNGCGVVTYLFDAAKLSAADLALGELYAEYDSNGSAWEIDN